VHTASDDLSTSRFPNTSWACLASGEMLKLFGTTEEQMAAIDQHFRLLKSAASGF
jgi:hypothetical protein